VSTLEPGVGASRPLASMTRMLAEHTRAQFLGFARNVALSAVTIVMPSLLFAFIAMSNGRREYAPGVTFGSFYLASMAAYAVSSVMIFNFGVTVAIDRGQKVDVLMRAGPLPSAVYLAARVVTALAFGLIALVVLFAFAYLAVGVGMPVTTWLTLGIELLVGAIPFIALGFAIAYLAGPGAAVAVANIAYLVLAFASGIFMPFDSLPPFVQSIAPYLPTYHYAQLAWSAVGLRTESTLASLAWLTAYSVAFLAVAAWAYRREEGRTFR
jgi:ABC-2 type transport system permease protein